MPALLEAPVEQVIDNFKGNGFAAFGWHKRAIVKRESKVVIEAIIAPAVVACEQSYY